MREFENNEVMKENALFGHNEYSLIRENRKKGAFQSRFVSNTFNKLN